MRYEMSHDELKAKFNAISFKINSLLAGQMPVKDIHITGEERVQLGAGMRCHFRMRAKGLLVPFRLHVTLSKGMGYVSLSTRFERPNRDRCGKMFALTNKNMLISYFGESDKEKLFADEYVFFTIEADRELLLTLQCNFGKSKGGARD